MQVELNPDLMNERQVSYPLKPNTCNNKARRIKFHQYVCQFLPRDHGGFGHKNQKMCDIFGIGQKVRHIDGTSGAKRGCNMEWTLVF